jgi:steroid 5-alpha reductase family enzyme
MSLATTGDRADVEFILWAVSRHVAYSVETLTWLSPGRYLVRAVPDVQQRMYSRVSMDCKLTMVSKIL